MVCNNCCHNCRFLFEDSSVGHYECLKEDVMTDEEFDEYEQNGYIEDCPHYEEDEIDMYDILYDIDNIIGTEE